MPTSGSASTPLSLHWEGLGFRLSEFEELEPRSFDEVLYADLATLAPGTVIRVVRGSHYLGEEDIRFVHYLPEWSERDPAWMRAPEVQRMFAMTPREVFDEVREQDPDYGTVERITRYTVRVDF